MAKKILAMLLALLMVASMIACSSTTAATTTEGTKATSSAATTESKKADDTTASTEEKDPNACPAAEDLDLSDTKALYNRDANGEYNFPLVKDTFHINMAQYEGYGNFGTGGGTFTMDIIAQNETYTAIQKNTNITIDWDIPASGEGQQAFSKMIASGNYADMMKGNFAYPGGYDAALDDGVYVDLTPYYNDYLWNYRQVIWDADDPQQALKEALTPTNRLAGIMWVYVPEFPGMNLQWWGQFVRSDLTEKAGCVEPHTIEDWDTILAYFKSTGIDYPYMMYAGYGMDQAFMAAYGIDKPPTNFFRNSTGFYLKDKDAAKKELTFGPLEKQNYTDYLRKMNEWVQKDYIHKDFASDNVGTDRTRFTAIWGQGKVAAMYHADGGIPQLDAALKAGAEEAGEEWDWAGVPYAKNVYTGGKCIDVLTKLYCSGGNVMVIFTACSDLKVMLSFCDYLCSPRGRLETNFGEEGISWNYDEEGIPRFTDLVLKAPAGPNDGWRLHAAVPWNVWENSRERNPQYKTEKNMETCRTWTYSCDQYCVYWDLTIEEEQEVAKYMNDINTYIQERTVKAIAGDESIDDWDNVIATLKTMGIDKCLEIYQAGFDKYENR